jgi:hypothetical protein
VLGIPVLASLLLFRSFGLPLGALPSSGGSTTGGSLRIVLLLPFDTLACSSGDTPINSLIIVLLLFLCSLTG